MLGCFQLPVQVQVAVVMSWKLLKVSRSRAPWQPCTAVGSCWRSLQSLRISAEMRRLSFHFHVSKARESRTRDANRDHPGRNTTNPGAGSALLRRHSRRIWGPRCFLLHSNHSINVPLSFRPFSSMVICSASSDSDSSMVWLPRSV